MIDVFNPYPSYKDSGVRWLGEVPAHWTVLRQRNAVDMRVSNVDKHSKDGELAVRLCNYVDVYKNDRIAERISFMRASATRGEIDRFRLQTGDVLITKDSETWDDIGVPALVEYSAPDLVCGYHIALLRPREGLMDGSFLLRVQQSLPVAYQYHISAHGVTRYGLSHDAIKSVFLPCPPLPEQAAIVRFLDHADRRIRYYIRTKQQLINLLEEQKQAIIHHAVTRGLDASVRLKPPGAEWVDNVPEHWEVRKLGQIAKVFNGATPSRMKPAYWQGGTIPWLSSGKVNEHVVETGSELVTERAIAECSISLVPRGSVILGLVGQGKTRGMSALLAIDACINQNLAALVPHRGLDGRFLHFLLTARYKQIRELGRGGNQEALNCDLVTRLRLPIPPLHEQESICRHLEQAVCSVVRTHGRVEREIALLREYRARLIADVVTGKLDVREAAAALPDEADESEVLDDSAVVDTEEAADDADLDAALEENEA
jgi:type I restriction enzyme, S subunit